MLENCKEKSVLCSALGVSVERMMTLTELLNIVSSVSLGSVETTKNNCATFSCSANVDSGDSYGPINSISLRKVKPSISSAPKSSEEKGPIFRFHNGISSDAATEVIDLESPSPEPCASKKFQPSRDHIKYDFFGSNSPPPFDDDYEDFNTEETETSEYFNSSPGIHQLASPPRANTQTHLMKQKPTTPIRLGSTSPGGRINPNKFAVGKFVGKVTNHGTTGEFDGFSYPHSSMMLNVICSYSTASF